MQVQDSEHHRRCRCDDDRQEINISLAGNIVCGTRYGSPGRAPTLAINSLAKVHYIRLIYSCSRALNSDVPLGRSGTPWCIFVLIEAMPPNTCGLGWKH